MSVYANVTRHQAFINANMLHMECFNQISTLVSIFFFFSSFPLIYINDSANYDTLMGH